MDATDHLPETTGGAGEVGLDTEPLFVLGQQLADALIEHRALMDHAAAEAEPDDRMAHRPVPAFMHRQTPEQRLVTGKQLGEGIKEQRLAEATRAREEIVLALLDQAQRKTGLIDIVVATFADLREVLDADREPFALHGLVSRWETWSCSGRGSALFEESPEQSLGFLLRNDRGLLCLTPCAIFGIGGSPGRGDGRPCIG